MSRVAIHLSGSPPTSRKVICEVFRAVKRAGGRIVTLARDANGEDHSLLDLIDRLGDDFDQLFTIAGDDFYEYIIEHDGPFDAATVAASEH